jgi:hypothetical protein
VDAGPGVSAVAAGEPAALPALRVPLCRGSLRAAAPQRDTLGSILDVEASHLALSKTENVSDRGNREVLRGFTDEEAGLLIALLTRLIANLDRIASVEASPGTPISEKGD